MLAPERLSSPSSCVAICSPRMAVTPEEVAVSILGEMIQFRRASLPPAKTMELEDDGTKVLVEVVSQASCGDPDAE